MAALVSVRKVLSYESGLTAELRELLAPLGGMEAFLLKPNLLGPFPPDAAVTTHPAVVEAAARLVLEAGGRCFVGDSSGCGSREAVLRTTGIGEVISRLNLEWADLDTPAGCEFPQARVARRIQLVAPLAGMDKIINLPKAKTKTQVTLYIPDVWKEVDTEQTFPCTVICPGGSYWWCSEREAEPVALRMVGNGIAAAVVNYACEYQHYPLQLLEILAAITYMRRNSVEFHIDPEKIAVMGFSAGGHAACTAGLFWQEKLAEETLGIEHGEDKPNGMILCYPVITSGKYTHEGSMKCLLGDDPDPKLLEKMSLEDQVTDDAPQAFIWHTSEDGLVPLKNSDPISHSVGELPKSSASVSRIFI